jgi:RNA binding exosome subunit
MHLIEIFPCNNKQELEEREGFYQKTIDCVNKRIETGKQSTEQIKKRKKQYREENIEKYRILSKQSYENSKKLLMKINIRNYYMKINIRIFIR